uniref:Transcription factor protein n=1 Tax=Ciona intestinalis TaxID=7719 RepID=F6U831_CIOIN|nr:transcription factor protein isoform X2 [Ciona intestinalis]|eukprot:XP_009857508.1 transcription factor protein isoform X2 [Ciona intestinalis]
MTPRKKKVSKLDLRIVKPEPGEVSSDWNQDTINSLLAKMLSNIPRPDNMKYSSMLDKVSWKDVSFENFTPEQCKMQWNKLSREIRKFRTLTELVEDVREYIRDPYKGQIKKHPDYPKRPLTPYFRFFMEKRDSFATQHKDLTNLEVTAELSKIYRSLPQKQKEKYVQDWKKETAEYKVYMKKFREEHPTYFVTRPTKPHEPRTPAAIYKEEQYSIFATENTDMSKKQCLGALKKKYKTLEDEEKQQYIDKALKEQEEYKNPDMQGKTKRPVLNKYERELHDKTMGRPKRPPSNGYNLFCTETMSQFTTMQSQKRIVECGRLWNLKSAEEKQKYHQRFIQMKQQYEKKLQEFYQSLSPERRKEEELKDKGQKKTHVRQIKMEKKELSDAESSDELDLNDSSSGEDDSADDDDDESEDEDKIIVEVEEGDEDVQPIPARPTTPISALFLYKRANRKKVEAQYRGMSTDEVTRLLARRYHELPEHKKHKYLKREKQLKEEYNEKMQQYLKETSKKTTNGSPKVVAMEVEPPVKLQPVTGEQLYHEKFFESYSKKHNHNRVAVDAALRVAWSKLAKVRREPFIKLAQQQNEKNIALYNNAMENVQQENPPRAEIHRVPAPIQSNKKIKFDGLPKKPPSNAYQLFSTTHLRKVSHLAQNEKFKELGRLWKSMSPTKKKGFAAESKRLGDKYKKELDHWIQAQTPEVADAFMNQQSKKRTKPTKANEVPPVKKLKEDNEQVANEEASSSDDSDDGSGSSSSDDDSDDDDSSSDSSDSDSESSSGDDDSSDSQSDD